MPMDGVMLGFMTRELNEKLAGGRVDKVTQPERDELILTIRNETRRFHLPDRVSRRRASGWTYDGNELCIHMDYD